MYKNGRLLFIVFSMLAAMLFIAGTAVAAYADDGRGGPGHNGGGQGHGGGGNGNGNGGQPYAGDHPSENATGFSSQFGGTGLEHGATMSDNFNGRGFPGLHNGVPDWNNRPQWDNMTDNFTGARPPGWNNRSPWDNMTDNFTGPRPPDWNNGKPWDNMTDNFTGSRPPWDNMTDNFTGRGPHQWGNSSENRTSSFISTLASILNIDPQTLQADFQQAWVKMFNR